MPCVRDIMSRPAFSVAAETTVAEVIRCLAEQQVSSIPVVSDQGAVVGIISEMALLDVLFDRTVRDAPVSEFMEHHVHVVHPADSLTHAARLLALYGIRRLPVVENGILIGIVARRELLSFALDSANPIADPLIELIPSLAQYM
jgi:CBS domain-containing protein